MKRDFGFEVKAEWHWDYEGIGENEKPTEKVFAGYKVSLPHQCDSWKIVGDGFDGEMNKDVAIARMEEFIRQAKKALEELKGLDSLV